MLDVQHPKLTYHWVYHILYAMQQTIQSLQGLAPNAPPLGLQYRLYETGFHQPISQAHPLKNHEYLLGN